MEHSVYGKFIDLFVEGVKKLKLGDPVDESTDVGPLIRESDAIRGQLDRRSGANGRTPALWRRPLGLWLTHCAHWNQAEMKVNCQEIFGPVVTVEPVEISIRPCAESTIPMACRPVFTRDAKLLFQAYEELEVGGVIAGDVPSFRIDQMPYGGVKDSGQGREGCATRSKR